MKKLIKLCLASALLFTLGACSSKPKDDPNQPITVKIGVVGEYNEQWNAVQKLIEKDNIKIELVKYADYSIPNSALAEKDIDLNAFQHYAFLENDIAKNGYKIESIGDTLIAPLGLFPNKAKITTLADIKEGAKIAIPNDATNGGRSLKLLEEAGLLKVDPTKGYLPTLADITENPLKLEIIEVEAALTYSLLPDCTAAIINGGHAVTNKLNPIKDSIYLETVDVDKIPDAKKLINLIAARSEDKDNEVYKKIVAAYQSVEVEAIFKDFYGGGFIPGWK